MSDYIHIQFFNTIINYIFQEYQMKLIMKHYKFYMK